MDNERAYFGETLMGIELALWDPQPLSHDSVHKVSMFKFFLCRRKLLTPNYQFSLFSVIQRELLMLPVSESSQKAVFSETADKWLQTL